MKHSRYPSFSVQHPGNLSQKPAFDFCLSSCTSLDLQKYSYLIWPLFFDHLKLHFECIMEAISRYISTLKKLNAKTCFVAYRWWSLYLELGCKNFHFISHIYVLGFAFINIVFVLIWYKYFVLWFFLWYALSWYFVENKCKTSTRCWIFLDWALAMWSKKVIHGYVLIYCSMR